MHKSCCKVWSNLNMFLMYILEHVDWIQNHFRYFFTEERACRGYFKEIVHILLLFTWRVSKEHINVVDKLIWFLKLHLVWLGCFERTKFCALILYLGGSISTEADTIFTGLWFWIRFLVHFSAVREEWMCCNCSWAICFPFFPLPRGVEVEPFELFSSFVVYCLIVYSFPILRIHDKEGLVVMMVRVNETEMWHVRWVGVWPFCTFIFELMDAYIASKKICILMQGVNF